MKGSRSTTDKEECDGHRRNFAIVMSNVGSILAECNVAIQIATDPDQVLATMKTGYLNALH